MSKNQEMKNGFIVGLAWPETRCKQAGAWYDPLMSLIGFNIDGYYEVGHAALLLISDDEKKCEYFDFGRYHSPHGFGRVRDQETDHDLEVHTIPRVSADKLRIKNMDEILCELAQNKSCHGDGQILASYTRINFDRAYASAKQMQREGFIAYGPLLPNGTNCSRFVNQIIRAGKPSLLEYFQLRFPFTVSPTPMTNIKSLSSATFKSGMSEMYILNPEIQLQKA